MLFLASFRPTIPAAHRLALLTGSLGLLPLLGYFYGASTLVGLGQYTQVAVHTAVLLILLSLGAMLLHPADGFMRLFSRDTVGGWLLRSMAPFVIGVPLGLGWLRVRGEEHGYFDGAFGTSLMMVTMITILLALTEWIARILNRDAAVLKRYAEASSRMVTIVRDSNDAITIQNFEGKITAWNRGAELMYGYSEEESLMAGIEWLTPPGKIEEQRDFMRRLMAGETVASFETQRVTKDGRILDIWMTVTKLTDDAGRLTGFTSTQRDITERRRAEAQARRMISELNRSNKELEQFAYVASHDLQEPLRMVSSYTQLLEQRYQGQLDEKAHMYINYAVDGAVRMQALINGLLAFARVGTQGKSLEPTDVQKVLCETIRNLGAMITENQAIVTYDALPTFNADGSQLAQVFQNLIANAIKFKGADIPHVHISARDDGREWVLAVKDNGIGIEQQYKDRIFVIFQRLHTRAEYPGTGIGLAICKRIAERHGGRIWFESELGKGATFFFAVPKQGIGMTATMGT